MQIVVSFQVDGWVDRRMVLRQDVHDDCRRLEAGPGFVRFRRQIVTCDPRDYRFEAILNASIFIKIKK
jgi:hypothetical protein